MLYIRKQEDNKVIIQFNTRVRISVGICLFFTCVLWEFCKIFQCMLWFWVVNGMVEIFSIWFWKKHIIKKLLISIDLLISRGAHQWFRVRAIFFCFLVFLNMCIENLVKELVIQFTDMQKLVWLVNGRFYLIPVKAVSFEHTPTKIGLGPLAFFFIWPLYDLITISCAQARLWPGLGRARFR